MSAVQTKRLLVSVIIAFFYFAHWQLPAHADPLAPAEKKARPFRRVQTTINAEPLIPIRIAFENQKTGEQQSVEWDPEVLLPLTQTVNLSEGIWIISLQGGNRIVKFNDNNTYDLRLDPDRARTDREKSLDVGPNGTQPITLKVAYKASTPPSRVLPPNTTEKFWEPLATSVEIKVLDASLQSLSEAKALLLTSDARNGFVRQGAVSSLEAAVPAAVLDLFQVLGEIAIERAKTKGFALLHERIKKAVCEEIPAQLRLELTDAMQTAMNVSLATTAATDPALLRHTCAVVSNFRLQDLETIRKPLLIAVLRDMGELGIDITIDPLWEKFTKALTTDESKAKKDLQEVLAALKVILRKAVLDQTAPSSRDAELLLLRLSQVDWPKVLPRKEEPDPNDPAKKLSLPSDVACGVDLAFAVAAQCHSQGGCAPAEVASRLINPGQYFSKDDCFESKVGSLMKNWPDLDRFVERLLLVFSPPKEEKPKSQMKNVMGLTIDIIDRFLRTSSLPDKEFALWVLKDTRAFAMAAIDGDVPEIIIAVGGGTQRVLGTVTTKNAAQKAALAKSMQLIGAVTAYASTYLPTTEKDPKQLHEARKKAIENLIDAATNRSERQGQWIVSLGANVGASLVGGQYIAAPSRFDVAWTHLSLPIGVAAQRLPEGSRCGPSSPLVTCPHRYFGYHFQLSPIDLGQFVSYDGNLTITSTKWANFLTASAQIGFLLGSATSPFMLGVDLRWSPTLFTQEQTTTDAAGVSSTSERGGAFRFGLYFGYYVPFFDFN